MAEVAPPPVFATSPRRHELELLLIGVDHRTAPLDLRERLVVTHEESQELLGALSSSPEIAESYLLSTCNRTELYLVPRDRDRSLRVGMDLVFGRRAPEVERDGRFYVLHDREATRHLFAVASGLESMVLGEAEILGQVRRAGELATAIGSSGTVLRRLLRGASEAGRRARTETEIGAGAVSLGYAVVELARQIFVGLEQRSCLILGAGETAVLVAQALEEKGIGSLRIANRSEARAAALTEKLPGARWVGLANRYDELTDADLVVASTSAAEPLLRHQPMAEVMRARESRPLLVVDLGVPRNVEPGVRKLENLFLHDLDSLQHLLERNLERRRSQVPRVERIVAHELERSASWLRSLQAEPLVARLQQRAEEIRQQELAGARRRFPAEYHQDLEVLTRSLVRKILHHPSHRLRAADREDRLAHLEAARELFQLDDDEEERGQ